MLRNYDSFLLSVANKVTTGTYNFVFLIVKMILLALLLLSLSLSFLLPTADKTENFVHFSFNSTLQLINCISNDLQKLLKYFNGTAIVAIFKIPLVVLAGWATVFPNNLALHLKDLKISVFAILLLKSDTLSLE